MSSEKVVKEIQDLIDEAGLSQRDASNFIFMEIDDSDDEEAANRFYERFKKKLRRTTTKEAELLKYKEILLHHTVISKNQHVTPNKIKVGAVPESILCELRKLSSDYIMRLESEDER